MTSVRTGCVDGGDRGVFDGWGVAGELPVGLVLFLADSVSVVEDCVWTHL